MLLFDFYSVSWYYLRYTYSNDLFFFFGKKQARAAQPKHIKQNDECERSKMQSTFEKKNAATRQPEFKC